MTDVINFQLAVEEPKLYDLAVGSGEEITAVLDTAVNVVKLQGEPYEGAYTITPSQETQVLETKNLNCTGNITINPIPSNFGLITWNGSFLTVS